MLSKQYFSCISPSDWQKRSFTTIQLPLELIHISHVERIQRYRYKILNAFFFHERPSKLYFSISIGQIC